MNYQELLIIYKNNRDEELELLRQKRKDMSKSIESFSVNNDDDDLLLKQFNYQISQIDKRIEVLENLNLSEIEELKNMFKPIELIVNTNTGEHFVIYENDTSYVSQRGYIISKADTLRKE